MTSEEARGQHGSCQTVKIKSGDSYAVINKSDYNPDEHELVESQSGDKGTGKTKNKAKESQSGDK
jgi:hypothetical protein